MRTQMIQAIIDTMKETPREGANEDKPEGIRYIKLQISDTLANEIVSVFEEMQERIKELEAIIGESNAILKKLETDLIEAEAILKKDK